MEIPLFCTVKKCGADPLCVKASAAVVRQSSCKPSSVSGLKTAVCHLSKPAVACGRYRSTLRRNCCFGRTTLKRRFTRTFNIPAARHAHRHAPGGLLPRLLTLAAPCGRGGCFLLQLACPRGQLPFRKGTVLCCPDFPPAGVPRRRQTGLLPFCRGCKVRQKKRLPANIPVSASSKNAPFPRHHENYMGHGKNYIRHNFSCVLCSSNYV